MDEELFFNGINGATGNYLPGPQSIAEIVQTARGNKITQEQKTEIDAINFARQERTFRIAEGYNDQDLTQAGWAVIFPWIWEDDELQAVREALSELLDHRKAQAGALYGEYSGDNGYKPDETKNEFISRHGSAPGDVKPAVGKLPYYLLIVGDPQSIPFEFQYELDVAYAVGRIHFDTLDEYAQYARSVVTAETAQDLKLRRQAVFFPVANSDDKATQLSRELLIQPLVENLKIKKPDDKRPEWELTTIPSDECTKTRLGQLLGGEETPAFLFTASHGMGFPKDHNLQLPFQGALLCQDWLGPGVRAAEVSRDFYFGGEDLGSDGSLLGLVGFHFACYGAGTPYLDDYSKQAFTAPTPIAPHAFLAALPKRMLSHPKGGALAFIGHVERAWTYSFKWREAGSQTNSFESAITALMAGKTVGSSLEAIGVRYGEVATSLVGLTSLMEIKPQKVSPYDMAGLWTAHNDARSYALIGDPAVRLPVARQDESATRRIAVRPLEIQRTGSAPIPLVPKQPESQTAQPGAAAAPPQGKLEPATSASTLAAQEDLNFASLGDMAGTIKDSLAKTLEKLVESLKSFADNITTLEVVTYTSENLENVTVNPTPPSPIARFSNAQPRAWTRIRLDGDTDICVPVEAGEIDQALWDIHVSMVQQAQLNRTEMLKAAAEVITSLLPKGS